MQLELKRSEIPPHLVRFFRPKSDTANYKAGDLVNIPSIVAEALRRDGWVLRQDIIWHKPAPMPESVRNRCTKAHEYVFLLTKTGSGYYCDMDAIREQATQKPQRRKGVKGKLVPDRLGGDGGSPTTRVSRDEPTVDGDGTSNRRSVWRMSSEGYSGAHFATFPQELPTLCIKAGTSDRGCCGRCGAPWQRVIEKVGIPKGNNDRKNDPGRGDDGRMNGAEMTAFRADHPVRTVGWKPSCGCVEVNEDGNDVPFSTVPCTVLDPFVGSGTTVMVANRLERRGIGIDLNEAYLAYHAAKRISGRPLDRSK